MGHVIRGWAPYFHALSVYNRQSDDVRGRVARDYFEIAALDMEGDTRRRLIAYGYRELDRQRRRA